MHKILYEPNFDRAYTDARSRHANARAALVEINAARPVDPRREERRALRAQLAALRARLAALDTRGDPMDLLAWNLALCAARQDYAASCRELGEFKKNSWRHRVMP